MKTPRCRDCTHWNEFSNMRGYGLCQRFPPQLVAEGNVVLIEAITRWPKTKDTEWCGEFKNEQPS